MGFVLYVASWLAARALLRKLSAPPPSRR